MQDILVFSDKDTKMAKSRRANLQQACCPAVINSIGSFRIDDSYGEKARLGDVYFLNSLPHPVFVLGLDHLLFSRHIVSQKRDIIKFAIQLILNGKIL